MAFSYTNFQQRYVPFAAVAAANCVNIPLMRQNELIDGIVVQDENGNDIGKSRLAAAKGMSQVQFYVCINFWFLSNIQNVCL